MITTELQEAEWLQDPVFMGPTKFCKAATKLLGGIKTRAFQLKPSLWQTQLSSDDSAHLTCLRNECTSETDVNEA